MQDLLIEILRFPFTKSFECYLARFAQYKIYLLLSSSSVGEITLVSAIFLKGKCVTLREIFTFSNVGFNAI